MCIKPATTVIQYVPGGFEDNTLACDEHVAALRASGADRTFPVEAVRADVPCCYVGPATSLLAAAGRGAK